MAERRMFAKTIVLSDAFLDLPLPAQVLYFHFGVTAYDKGIVIGAKSIARAIGCAEENIRILVDGGYLAEIEDGNYKIVHWYENNSTCAAKKRNTYEYRQWRKAVINRDGCCQLCGSKHKLVAHHKKAFSAFPSLRLDLENGITLCHDCHAKLHGLEAKDGKKENVQP